MIFDATNWPEDTYSFAVRFVNNGPGGTIYVPVTMQVSNNAGIEEPQHPIPLDFGLTSAFPNPFNAVVAVDYRAPVGSLVKLRIFDIAGREVASLVDAISAGSGHSVWRADKASSGVYILRLEAGGRKAQMKVVLVK